MKNIDVKDILAFSHTLLSSDRDRTYDKSYQCFVEFFSEKSVLTEQDLVIGANFTYGWMPTIMNFKSDKFDEALLILNKAKLPDRINTDEVLLLKSLVNNSLVGASKLLHFVNPNIYSIWDSRVCKFLLGKYYKDLVERADLFWDYLDLCERVAAEPEFMSLHSAFQKSLGYEVTPLRVIEQLMFLNSRSTIVKKELTP